MASWGYHRGNKNILDIGCGMGQHAKQYSDMGAKSVLGIDISEKMLEYAGKHFDADNITYRQMAPNLCSVCHIPWQQCMTDNIRDILVRRNDLSTGFCVFQV